MNFSQIFPHLAFMIFVVMSVIASNVTGFALALVLIGLVGVTGIVPLPDAVNAVTMIIIVNAALFLFKRRPLRIQPAIKPAVLASLFGSLAGSSILIALAAYDLRALRMLLGVCVIGCALILWRTVEPYKQESGRSTFALVGALSGLLGGLFATAGPPLVYAVYRQPWSIETIQESLIFSFGAGAILRLTVMTIAGQITPLAMQLALESIPVALLVTYTMANRKPQLSKEVLQKLVCILLLCAGIGILA
jgi:cytochrome bd-type quinol oxidase subunit 1